MEYTVHGIITLLPLSKIRLSSDVSFVSPSKAEVTLSSKSDEQLSVLIKLEAADDDAATELARLELSRICNVLSFYHNIAVSKSRISGMSCISTSEGHTDVRSIVICTATATLGGVILGFDNKSLSKLVSSLQQDYSDDFGEVMDLWREALSRESLIEKFLSLYRLMELLFDGNGPKVEEWIKKQNPPVQLVPANEFRRFRRYEHTVYTFLRDNIAHCKRERKTLPIKEVQHNLARFQTLVQQRIKEKYNIQ